MATDVASTDIRLRPGLTTDFAWETDSMTTQGTSTTTGSGWPELTMRFQDVKQKIYIFL